MIPTMRSQYMRTAFQVGNDASVRISLDTNLCMIYERDAGVMEGGRWYRDPTVAVPEDQITRFPHAVLEIKLEIAEGNSTPAWVKDMLSSGMVCEVHKFSKFIHGCAVLMQEDVQAVPYWVDDPSLALSIDKSKGAALLDFISDRIDANLQCPQLLPYGDEGTSRRRTAPASSIQAVFEDPSASSVPNPRSVISASSTESNSPRKLPSSPTRKSAGELRASGEPVLPGNKAMNVAPSMVQAKTEQQSMEKFMHDGNNGGIRERESSFVLHSRMNYYEQEANSFPGGQWCAGTSCWWFGSEHLVADDLTTPLQKLEPKQHFANERTLLHWFHQAVYLTGLASAVLAFAPSESLVETHALILLVLACTAVLYAVYTFHRRGEKIRERQQVRWDDPYGPILLGTALVVSLGVLFTLQVKEMGLL